VNLATSTSATFLGQARRVLVSWRADNGDRLVTGFQPRNRAESAALVCAVQRLMKISSSLHDASATPDGAR
jgi:hypothetical protein